jgi:hypothetical protein
MNEAAIDASTLLEWDRVITEQPAQNNQTIRNNPKLKLQTTN